MKQTIRYAHLKAPAQFPVGSIVKRGQCIGRIGSTGESYGDHVHIDNVLGWVDRPWDTADYLSGRIKPDPEQIREYFIDKELLGGHDFRISNWFMSPKYKEIIGKDHWGFDVVYLSGAGLIYWNRSFVGRVLFNGFDNGYGNKIIIGYEV